MSNDLISRSAVLALVDKLGYVNCFDTKDYACNSRVDKIRQSIVELPTAYDVNKVVEQLDKASDYYECEEQGREHVQMIDLTEAIEIVKAGGASDNH